MTYDEIIKALECCSNDDDGSGCGNCPFGDRYPFCDDVLQGEMLDLINRLQAENERLREDGKRLKKVQMQLDDLCIMHNIIKAEAIKEFADRLKADIVVDHENPLNSSFPVVTAKYVDDLVKEMVGDNNG